MNNTILPFFPLPMAVLPGQTISLHIFEPRYLDLVKDCQDGQEFGINMSSDSGMAVMGCSLKIVSVQKNYDDRKLDIVAKGVSRYKLESVIKEKSYDQAEVEYVEDSGLYTLSDQKIAEFKKLHQQVATVVGAVSTADLTPEFMSYQSACILGLEDLQKQTLLELKAEDDRLGWLADLYTAILEAVKSEGSLARDFSFGNNEDPGLGNLH